LQKVRFWDPAHWRFRAEQTRTVADQMTHEEERSRFGFLCIDGRISAPPSASHLASHVISTYFVDCLWLTVWPLAVANAVDLGLSSLPVAYFAIGLLHLSAVAGA